MTDQSSSENNSCDMVGLLGLLIQLSLGVLSFSVLILKRCGEKPPRPWNIWLFDTSKQLVSQLFAHFINLTISIALTYEDRSSDECLWYFTTNILDNTIGVLMCVFCLVNVQRVFTNRGKLQYVSGNYYSIRKVVVNLDVIEDLSEDKYKRYELKQQQNLQLEKQDSSHKTEILNEELEYNVLDKNQQPQEDDKSNNPPSLPNHHNQPSQDRPFSEQAPIEDNTQIVDKYSVNYKAWLVQLGVWLLIVVIGKSILFGLEFGLESSIKDITFALMGWIENYQLLELMVVIVIVPVIMNGFAFWIQDNFLMKKQDLTEEPEDKEYQFKDHPLKEAHPSEHQ